MRQKSPIILEALLVFNLSSTAWDDIAKYCGLDGLNKRHFLTVMEAGKPKTKVLADSILGEDSLPVLKTAAFLYCVPLCERGEIALSSLFYITLGPSWGAHSHDQLFLITSQRHHFQIFQRVRVSPCEFGGRAQTFIPWHYPFNVACSVTSADNPCNTVVPTCTIFTTNG